MKPVHTLLAVALALAATPALAQTYSQTVFFGDSLSDTGHFRPALAQNPAVGPANAQLLGKFTTNPGLVWAEYLADFYGTAAVTDNQGGTDYAVGGARVGTNSVGALGATPSLATQTANYLAAHGGRADANALYTVWGGANDLFAVAANPSQAQTIIGGAVTAEVGIVGSLQAAGARYVMVATIPDLGLTPAARAQGAAAQAQQTQLAASYNAALFGGLASAGLRVIPLDTFHLFQEVAANPGSFGFSNITGTACQPQITAQSITCSPASYVRPDAATTYAFADGVHPTTAAHEIIADYAVSMLEAPRQIALLSNAASMVGRARADQIASHAGKTDADGMRWWAGARGDFQRYDKGNLYDGAGPSLTGGVDWTRGNLVYGGFLGYGRQSLDFGLNGGSFDQSDATLGGFVGWFGEGGGWFNGQLSYTQLSFDIDRTVQLGRATRTHTGSPDGRNVSLGASGGWQFGEGALHHGPVLSVLAQQIRVDGYAESEPSLSTSLAYRDQSFDSLIGSAGWQVNYAVNDHLTPYARLTVDREFQDQPEQAFARSQSLVGSGEYAVPGVHFDQSYGTLLMGARTQLFGLDANLGTSVTVGQEGGNHASVFVNVGSSF